jgi:hypothetical protein
MNQRIGPWDISNWLGWSAQSALLISDTDRRDRISYLLLLLRMWLQPARLRLGSAQPQQAEAIGLISIAVRFDPLCSACSCNKSVEASCGLVGDCLSASLSSSFCSSSFLPSDIGKIEWTVHGEQLDIAKGLISYAVSMLGPFVCSTIYGRHWWDMEMCGDILLWIRAGWCENL